MNANDNAQRRAPLARPLELLVSRSLTFRNTFLLIDSGSRIVRFGLLFRWDSIPYPSFYYRY